MRIIIIILGISLLLLLISSVLNKVVRKKAKQFFSKMYDLMLGIVLFLISMLLFIILFFIGFIYAIIKPSKEYYKTTAKYLFGVALSIDQTGNVVCSELFNDILIKKGGRLFGNPDKTISHYMGVNKQMGTLTICGKILDWVLSVIDKNHSINSIGN